MPIVAGTISLATGAAWLHKSGMIRVFQYLFLVMGGFRVHYEMMNFAGLKKIPIVFVCENNLYSTHLPVNEIPVNSKISEIAKAFRLIHLLPTGNHVLEVYELGKKAIETCRINNGTVFLEFLTYRLRGHVGPNDIIQGTKTDIRTKTQLMTGVKMI